MVSNWLAKVPGLDFLTDAYKIDWSPSFDLMVINFSLHLGLSVSLLSIVGAAIAIWVYRKM
nr:DUF4321 domain-containing protein [Cohnella lubricantis]